MTNLRLRVALVSASLRTCSFVTRSINTVRTTATPRNVATTTEHLTKQDLDIAFFVPTDKEVAYVKEPT